jgi:outer membrane protein
VNIRGRTPHCLALLPLCACAAGHAQSLDNVVKIGMSRYDTHSSTTGITGAGIPPGADAKTGDATTVIFVGERMLTPNIGLEFVIGVPPTIHGRATGSVTFLGDNVLVAKAVAPVLLLNYHFGSADDRWRPYVGAGINYTHFYDVRSSLGVATLSNSTGLALQAGLHYALNKSWGAFASVARIDAKTEVTVTGATVLTTTLDLKPWIYTLGLTYSF